MLLKIKSTETVLTQFMNKADIPEGEKKTFKELKDMGVKVFYIRSYGYQESGIFGCYQPFGKARIIPFKLDSFLGLYDPNWLLDTNVEDDDLFVMKNGKWVSFMDYDLYA